MRRLLSRRLFASAISFLGLACWAGAILAGDLKGTLPNLQKDQQIAPEMAEKAPPGEPPVADPVLPTALAQVQTTLEATPKAAPVADPSPALPGTQPKEPAAPDAAAKTSPTDKAGEPTPVVAGQEDPGTKTPPANQQPAEVINGQDNGTGSYWTSLFQSGHFLGGAGMYVIAPIFESNRAFHSSQPPLGGFGTGPTMTSNVDFDYHLTVSPRIWFGYFGEGGWGVRVNAWHFDQTNAASGTLSPDQIAAGGTLSSASPAGIFPITSDALAGIPGSDILTASTRLKFTAIDIEATKAFTVGQSLLLISAGARLARIDQQYNAALFNTANDPNVLSVTEQLDAHQRFIGAGPTVSFEGHCPIGNRGLGLYGLVRGALLVGDYHNEASSSLTATAANVTTFLPGETATSPRDAVVPVGEFELGAEWNGTWGRIRPLLRLGVTGQSYFNALNNNNAATAGDNGPSSLNGNLTFFGFTVTAGITY